MSFSHRLRLPFLASGQRQKEVTHNESLLLLDGIAQATCASGGPANEPPVSPQAGQAFLCGSSPVGDWEGQADAFAIWTEGGWRFVQAFEGLQASEMLTGCPWRFTAGQWVRGELCAEVILVDGKKVLGGQLPAISAPSGGATIDVECRAQLTAVLAALRTHGLIAS